MIDNNVNEKWISIDDAAEYLGVKPVTIRAVSYTHLDVYKRQDQVRSLFLLMRRQIHVSWQQIFCLIPLAD